MASDITLRERYGAETMTIANSASDYSIATNSSNDIFDKPAQRVTIVHDTSAGGTITFKVKMGSFTGDAIELLDGAYWDSRDMDLRNITDLLFSNSTGAGVDVRLHTTPEV